MTGWVLAALLSAADPLGACADKAVCRFRISGDEELLVARRVQRRRAGRGHEAHEGVGRVGQDLDADGAGDAVAVRAPGFAFIKGEPLARLKDGSSLEEARAELDVLEVQQLHERHSGLQAPLERLVVHGR